METENKRMGIFTMFGTIFGFMGRIVDVLDRLLTPIETAAKELNPLVAQTFEALNLALEPAMDDLRNESLINKAKLKVSAAKRDEEVATILASIQKED